MKVEQLINYGIVNIDKPPGPTSHQVSDFVKRILKLKKAGHGGTLDPNVTGVLPVALGDATRIVQVLLLGGKEYVGIMHLHKPVEEKIVKRTIKKYFTGKIKQIPPIKSAVKRQEREREIYSFDILEIDGQDVLFRVACQAGTYIRKLCHDIGKQLEVGAHMSQLRRTKVGPFDESTLVTLHDLKDAYEIWKETGKEEFLRHCIQPIENTIKNVSKVYVQDSAVESLIHGRDLAIPGIVKMDEFLKDDVIAIMSQKKLVALGIAVMPTEQIEKKKKGVAVKTHKVFLKEK
ncbi:RNA-guided pseudouridylation complex pseudouridine synthase subunit Cbf5 [Nanoarchaeota archaeon]